jgi:hypothetical protein
LNFKRADDIKAGFRMRPVVHSQKENMYINQCQPRQSWSQSYDWFHNSLGYLLSWNIEQLWEWTESWFKWFYLGI